MFFFYSYYKNFFLMTSLSWLNLWLWMEINLISFIAFLINNKKKLNIEASLIYFLIQTIASIMFIYSIMMINFKINFIYLFLVAVMVKISSTPFHFWLPIIIESLSWMKIFMLLTWQKINPLMILMMNNFKLNLFLFIVLSMIVGSISGLNYSSLKKMISFSSINQLSWMMMSLINNKLIKLFIIMYMYLMFMITKSLNLMNLKFLNQMFNFNLKNKFIKVFIFMNFLSLGGLPPFLGFFPKLFILIKLNNLMILLMLMFSLISLYMYMRIIYSMMILNSMKMNLLTFNNKKKNSLLMKFMIINNLLLNLIFFFY